MTDDRIELEVRIAKVETRQDSHETICAERYKDIKDSVKSVNEALISTARDMRDGQAALKTEIAVAQERLRSEITTSNDRLKVDLMAKQEETSRARATQISAVQKTQDSMLKAVWTLAGTTIFMLLSIIGYLLNAYVIKGAS